MYPVFVPADLPQLHNVWSHQHCHQSLVTSLRASVPAVAVQTLLLEPLYQVLQPQQGYRPDDRAVSRQAAVHAPAAVRAVR